MGHPSPPQGDGLIDHNELRAPRIFSPSFCPLGDAIRCWACRAPRVGPGGQREAWLSSCVCSQGRPGHRALPQTCDPAGADVQCARQAQHVSQSDASRLHLGPLPRADGVPVKSALTQTDTWGCPSLTAVCFTRLPSCSQGSPPRCTGRASGESPSDVTSRRGETPRRWKYCTGDYMARERRARPQKQ